MDRVVRRLYIQNGSDEKWSPTKSVAPVSSSSGLANISADTPLAFHRIRQYVVRTRATINHNHTRAQRRPLPPPGVYARNGIYISTDSSYVRRVGRTSRAYIYSACVRYVYSEPYRPKRVWRNGSADIRTSNDHTCARNPACTHIPPSIDMYVGARINGDRKTT